MYICLVFATRVLHYHYGHTRVHTESNTIMMNVENVYTSCLHMPRGCVDSHKACLHIARASVDNDSKTLSTHRQSICGFQVRRQRMYYIGLVETLDFVRIAYTAPLVYTLYPTTRMDDSHT